MNATRFLRLAGVVAGATMVLGAEVTPALDTVSPVEVTYQGPRSLQGEVTLRAEATTHDARIVAVTFSLDGVPLGSDATPPYALDTTSRLLPHGVHRLRVSAVDTRGRRAVSERVSVRVRPGGRKLLTATPERGLHRALAALRRGGVTVRLAPGRYVLSDLTLGSGARLVGAGDATVIAPRGEAGYFAAIVTRGRGIRVSDLTVQGGGPGAGEGMGVAVFEGSADVRLQRLNLLGVRGDGVSTWGSHSDISIQDSTIDGGGTGFAGVRALGSDASRDVSVIRTSIRGFRGYGIVFAQKEYGRQAAALHALALDNTITDISDPTHAACSSNPLASGCGTTEAAIESGAVGAAIIGNTIRRARWDGIETVGSSTGVSVVRNDIAQTRVGIYVEHMTVGSRIELNRISAVRTGVNVEWFHDGAGSRGNTIARNDIANARYAPIFVDVGADANRIVGNRFLGGARPAIVLQGSSGNLVRANRGCRVAGPVVVERTGWWQDGKEARPNGNLISGNVHARSCPPRDRP
jgi:hypothetical protein